jgi:hypothetical protein
MKITGYDFGRIVLNDKTFTSDVIIMPDRVIGNWRRRQGHSLLIDDLDAVVQAKPDVLVVGTGYYGRMQIPDDTRHYLETQGIDLKSLDTRAAVTEFNRLQKEYACIVAALHLSC